MKKITVVMGMILAMLVIMVFPCYGADGLIYGCYQKNNGQLRIVNKTSECRPSEVAISWNQIGPPGPAGEGTGGGLLFWIFCGPPGVVWYVNPYSVTTVEREAQFPVPRDGRLVSLAVNPWDSELDGDALITVRVNGSDSALQIAVPFGSTAVETFKTTVPVLAGNLLSLQVDTRAASSGGFCAQIIYEFIAN